MADVQGKLDEIVTMIEQAKGKALSQNQAVVPRQDLLAALEQLREALPGEMSEARRTLRERDEIIEAAKAEGRRLLATAREECRRLVDEHEVLVRAERAAAELADDAQEQATLMREQTDAYVESALARVEALLEDTLSTVTTGRRRIRDARDGAVELAGEQAESDDRIDVTDDGETGPGAPGVGAGQRSSLVG